MRLKNGRTLIVMLAIALLTIFCKGTATANDPVETTDTSSNLTAGEADTPAPYPTTIEITLQEGSAVTETIGPEGGSMSVTGFDARIAVYQSRLASRKLPWALAQRYITCTA